MGCNLRAAVTEICVFSGAMDECALNVGDVQQGICLPRLQDLIVIGDISTEQLQFAASATCSSNLQAEPVKILQPSRYAGSDGRGNNFEIRDAHSVVGGSFFLNKDSQWSWHRVGFRL